MKATLGGTLFGLVGVALPLTMFTGSDQLGTVLSDAGTLGIGLLVALLLRKTFTFGVCQASGSVGGPIFPALFHWRDRRCPRPPGNARVSLGLAFTYVLAAVPGSMMAAPFTHGAPRGIHDRGGALQTAPILIAV